QRCRCCPRRQGIRPVPVVDTAELPARRRPERRVRHRIPVRVRETMAAELTADAAPALELRDITMRFGAFRALKNVDFLVNPGEIVALLGENGCGKSTLVKVLAGVNAPEPGGELYLGGRQVSLPLLPGQFRDLGLSFVHQDLGLGRTLSVVENLIVGERGSARSRKPINWRTETRQARKTLDSYGVRVDPRLAINRLPPVGQALVAI